MFNININVQSLAKIDLFFLKSLKIAQPMCSALPSLLYCALKRKFVDFKNDNDFRKMALPTLFSWPISDLVVLLLGQVYLLSLKQFSFDYLLRNTFKFENLLENVNHSLRICNELWLSKHLN